MQIVITTAGTFITQKDECFRLKQKDKVYDISPLKVESIVISNQAMISSQAIVLALEHNIDTIFMDAYGYPVGRVWFSKMGSTALIRRKQLEAMDGPLGLRLVIDMVTQKIDNQIHFLKKLMHASTTVTGCSTLLWKRPASCPDSIPMSDSCTRIITIKSPWCLISSSPFGSTQSRWWPIFLQEKRYKMRILIAGKGRFL